MNESFRRFAGRGHATAIPTTRDGIRFPSKTEARVYQRLALEARADRATLFRQVRLPLLSLAPDDRLRPLYLTIDFLLLYPDGRVRAVDAKAKRWKSRDWARGAAAFTAFYGTKIETVNR